MKKALLVFAMLAAFPALADFNDKKPVTATVTGATPSGYPRTMVEGLNAVVRDAYPGSAVSFKPNSPGGGVQAIATGQADFTATATGTEIRLANEGSFPFKQPLKGKFSLVMQLYDNQFVHFLMTKEWADANGIRSWDDIAAKKPRMRLAINRPDNPQVSIGGPYALMEAHGFTIQDIEKWLIKLAPEGDYLHHRTGETNGDAHLKNLLIGHQVILPITGGKLDLGPWQQVYYAEFDGQRRKRVLIKVIGE